MPVVVLRSSIIVFMSCEWIATGIDEYNFMYYLGYPSTSLALSPSP